MNTCRDDAPSAIRTPISLVRRSTRYDNTLKRPDTVSSSASPPRISETQKAICRKNVSSPRQRLHGDHISHGRTSKYADDTDLKTTDVLPAPLSATAMRSGASNCGLTAAYAVM